MNIKEQHKIIDDYITNEILSEYLISDSVEELGIYSNGEVRICQNVNKKIVNHSRPFSIVKCPGIESLNKKYYMNDDAYYSEKEDMYYTKNHIPTTLEDIVYEFCINNYAIRELSALRGGLKINTKMNQPKTIHKLITRKGKNLKGVLCAKHSPDGKRIVTISEDANSISLIYSDTLEKIVTLKGMEYESPICVEWSPDGTKMIVLCYGAKCGVLLDYAFLLNIAYISNTNWEGVRHAKWSPDGSMIVVTSFITDDIRVVDGTTLEEIVTLTSPNYRNINYVEWSPDGTKIVITLKENSTVEVLSIN